MMRTRLDNPVPGDNYERARSDLIGLTQVQQLGAALRGENWQYFPESDCRD